MMGKIACANVLSDLYAMGVVECDNMLMLLSSSSKFTDKERDVVLSLMMQGFRDLAKEAGTSVTGGQTVINPWCLIGGVATTVCQQNEFIMPDQAVPGDVLVLTKPLGTQLAVNAYQWMLQKNQHWNRIKFIVTKEETENAYSIAMLNMARLNKVAAQLMHVYGAHAATDVTGFGILGHADNLAKQQRNEVNFVLHNLPILEKMAAVAKASVVKFGLLKGTSAETSGGLLIVLPREQAEKYCKEIVKLEGHQAWIIGIVEKGERKARIIDRPRVIEVPNVEPEPVPTPIVLPTPPPTTAPVSRKRNYEAIVQSPSLPLNTQQQQPQLVQTQPQPQSSYITDHPPPEHQRLIMPMHPGLVMHGNGLMHHPLEAQPPPGVTNPYHHMHFPGQ